MRRRFAVFVASVCLLAPAGCAREDTQAQPSKEPKAAKAAESKKIELNRVKHDALLADIKAQKGKVVVIDFWGWFCVPCKEEFPHLVELHDKHHEKDGLVCMSVSVDNPESKEDETKALGFLREKKAAFANYLLDENPPVWQNHWDLYGPPAVFVFDKTGKMAGRFDHNDPNVSYSYADVAKLVQKLLAPSGE